MNDIELVFPTKAHETDAKEYFEEHILNGENSLHGDSGLDSAGSYYEWLKKINDDLTRKIHSIIFFAIRKSDKKLIGTINVRHPYLDFVQIHGHIGYGIRPSERRQGYATLMLKLALEYCKTIGLKKVLLTCNKSNIASAKTIMKCSGAFENEEKQSDGELLQRYWIEL
jgi:predicted acetyltransferase